MLESLNKTVDENWEDFKSVLLKGMNMFIPCLFVSSYDDASHQKVKNRRKLPSIQQRAPAADP